jgi:hypothetical protein
MATAANIYRNKNNSKNVKENDKYISCLIHFLIIFSRLMSRDSLFIKDGFQFQAEARDFSLLSRASRNDLVPTQPPNYVYRVGFPVIQVSSF